jgi:acetoacetate decarboxylase
MITTKGTGRLGLSAELGRGHTFPASSPLFPDFPVTCRNVESISVLFETDSEAALELIPAMLDIPKPATAALNILHIPTSGMGEFYEASLILDVLYKGEAARYNVLQFVTNDMSFALGREALGSPKKLAHITLKSEPEGMLGIAERPLGHRILSLSATLEKYRPREDAINVVGPSIALRIIPRPTGENRRAAAELLSTKSSWIVREQWVCNVSVSTPTQGGADDWSVLPRRRILQGMFRIFDDITMFRPQLLEAWDIE